MSALTPASEVILRHHQEFASRHVLFAGDLQDSLPLQFNVANILVHTTQYHHWQHLSASLHEQCHFSLTANPLPLTKCDTLIYYWPKCKQEAKFQLMNLFSLLPLGCDLFIVGANRAGIRSAKEMVANVATLHKIDSARRCGLYHGHLEKQSDFHLDDWWQYYQTGSLNIATLPGVFSRDDLDTGSHLLLSSLEGCQAKTLLDVGCGAGVLAAALGKISPKTQLTLCDVSAAALASSQATLHNNALEGKVIASNIYSNITDCYDLIIANPPFHEGLQTSLTVAETLIREAISHLHINGELRLVANAFLPYPHLLDEVFGYHQVIAQTGRFKVYSAKRTHSVKGVKRRG